MKKSTDELLRTLWTAYLRSEISSARFSRKLREIYLPDPHSVLLAYRAVAPRITDETRDLHRIGLHVVVDLIKARGPQVAKAILLFLREHELLSMEREMEMLELDVYENGPSQFAEYAEDVLTRRKQTTAGARIFLDRAIGTLELFRLVEDWTWSASRRCHLYVETRTHPLVINRLVERCKPELIVFESIAEQNLYEFPDCQCINLDEYLFLNSDTELACYDQVPEIAEQIIASYRTALGEAIPGLELLLEVNKFLLEDFIFGASKRAISLLTLIDEAPAEIHRVFALADGHMIDCTRHAGHGLAGDYYLWCDARNPANRSKSIGRFDYRGPPSALKTGSATSIEPSIIELYRLGFVLGLSKWPDIRTAPRRWLRMGLKHVRRKVLLRSWNVFRWRSKLPVVRGALRLFSLAWRLASKKERRWHKLDPEILFVTTPSPIYTETVKDLLDSPKYRQTRSAVVLRSADLADNFELSSYSALDYLEPAYRTVPRFLNNLLTRVLVTRLNRALGSNRIEIKSQRGMVLIQSMLRQAIPTTVSATLLRTFAFHQFMQRTLDSTSPHTVVLAPDRTPEAMLTIRLCEARGIPTWAVQTVYHSRHPKYKPLQAQYGSVIDTWSFELFRDHYGTDQRRLFITGTPRMHLDQEAGQYQPKKKLLFICQRGVPFNQQNLDFVLRNCGAVSDYEIVVRPHPSENEAHIRTYRKQLAQFPSRQTTVEFEGSLSGSILESSAVLTAYSNVGLEASLYGVPVIVLNPDGITYPVELDSMGIGIRADSDKKLKLIFERLKHDKTFGDEIRASQQQYLDLNQHLVSGDPAERIMGLLVHGVKPHTAQREPVL